MRSSYPLYLANKPVPLNTALPVTNKYTGETATLVALADQATIEHAIAAAAKAADACRRMTSFRRAAVLQHGRRGNCWS